MSINPQSKRFMVLNNEGVYMVKNGRFDEAIDCFIAAIQLINHTLESSSMRDDDTPPPSSAATPYLAAFSMIQGDHQVLSVPVNSHQSQYVFQNPIIVRWRADDLSVDKEMQSQEDVPGAAHLFLVAFYNLALSYHLSALETKCTNQLEQALSYYALSYEMLLNERDVVVSQAMVILNNIGHIHRLLHNEEGAKNCFQYLLTTMLFVQQSGESDRIQNWDSFLSNVMYLMVAAGPQPAAAA